MVLIINICISQSDLATKYIFLTFVNENNIARENNFTNHNSTNNNIYAKANMARIRDNNVAHISNGMALVLVVLSIAGAKSSIKSWLQYLCNNSISVYPLQPNEAVTSLD